MSKSSGLTEIPLHCDDITVQLKFPTHGTVLEYGKKSLIDVDALVRQALDCPDAYPPIRHAVIAGDRIVLACSAIVPGLERLLAIVASYFVESGIEAGNLTLLLAERCSFERETFEAAFQSIIGQRTFRSVASNKPTVEVEIVQGPFDREDLAYLAADAQALPLYIHRLLVDADFALCLAQLSDSRDILQASVGAIVPWFCDKDTRKRWNASAITQSTPSGGSSDYSRNVQWLLGPGVTMTVAPQWQQDASAVNVQANTIVNASRLNPNETARLAGESNVDVVIGVLRGEGSWSSFAETLARLADQLTVSRGRIVVACKHLPAPTSAFRILRDIGNDEEKIYDALAKSDDPYASDIAYIASVMVNHSIFTLELQSRERASLPWESIGSIDECALLLRTADCPVIVL